jgi:hypothetical protein
MAELTWPPEGDGHAAGVGHIGILLAQTWGGTEQEAAVFRLQHDVPLLGDEIDHRHRHPESEVDHLAILQFQRRPARNHFPCIHSVTALFRGESVT